MRINFFGAFVFLVTATLALPTQAEEISDDAIDFRPSLLRDEWYSEGWDQVFYFEDGSLLVAQITILNVGFGSHHAGVFAMLVTPDGKKTIIKQSRSNRKWEFSENLLDLQIAENRLSGKFPAFQVLIRQSKGEVEVDFTATAEPWRLGKTLKLGEAYQYVSFYAPALEAEGRYRIRADKETEYPEWQSVAGGRGFAVRYVNSIGLHNLIRSSTRIVDLENANISPILYTSVDKEGRQQGYLTLYENGRLIHEAGGFELLVKNRVETADDDKRNIPESYRIHVEEKGISLTGTIETEKFLARVDPVDSLKPFVRTIVKFLNTPIQYRYLANYDLDYQKDGQQVRLHGRALIDHMVLRHERRERKSTRNTR